MSSVFSKIVAGEIPAYKIYEDEKVLAFLDINPETKGHTLVIPKIEVDKLYDLDDETYTHLMLVCKKISKNMDEKLGARTLWKVVGTDVPHAHVHLTPLDPNWQYGKTLKLSETEFKELQEKLKLS